MILNPFGHSEIWNGIRLYGVRHSIYAIESLMKLDHSEILLVERRLSGILYSSYDFLISPHEAFENP